MLPDTLLENKVYKYFQRISDIPRASYKEKAISDYLVSFAEDHGYEYIQDDLYNVIIVKQPSIGREEDEAIILQGHMDMVCEKESDYEIDFESEGLSLGVDGDYIYAKGTTLGADDGIAVAMALAVLDDDSLSLPKIEFICTVSEEVGMEGATGIDLSSITGRKMINIDTEEEGHFLAGCAGGGTVSIQDDYASDNPIELEDDYLVVDIKVSNLIGGHSGIEINRGRANANILMIRILKALSEADMLACLEGIQGGSKDNAIPRECQARVVIGATHYGECKCIADNLLEQIKEEYAGTDDGITISMEIIEESLEQNVRGLDRLSIESMCDMLLTIPNGVVAMSKDIEGMVETSLNLGVLSFEKEKLQARYCVRSGVDEEYDRLVASMQDITNHYHATLSRTGEYPAWEYVATSNFRDLACQEYEKMFGQTPCVETVHAGVECGIIAKKLEGLEALCIGPDILDIHTPKERLSISSTDRTYKYLLRLLTM